VANLFGGPMPRDYEASYNASLRDQGFLAWREVGARQKAKNISRICHGIKIKSAIEIGCGTGAVLYALRSMNFAEDYACTDLSSSAVQFVRQLCEDFAQRAFVAPADALPFQDNTFDAAILTHVIEHLDDPLSAVREASRVARYVVIEVPTEKVLSNMIRTKVLGRAYVSIEGAGHVQFWSPGTISTFLKRDCGLEILARRRDLISREVEFYGKKRFGLVKPLFKEALKTVLPSRLYSQLLTTHATFLCRRADSGEQILDFSAPLGKSSV
jgi:SAM-dependent methyltransferase